MLKLGHLLKSAQNRRGATAVIVVVCLVVLLVFAALAIDIGYISTTKNELQNVADAAALAGAGYLGSVYATLSYAEQQVKEFTFNEVAEVVRDVALKNKAAGVNIDIDDGDIVIGNWNGTSVDFNLSQPDAVYVKARRDSTINNPVSTFFARIFKIFGANFDTVNISADATAALTGSTVAEEGELKTPFGLSNCLLPSDCRDLISFSPTTESCAGWHNFLDHVSAHDMEQKMLGLIKGDPPDLDDDGIPDSPCLKEPCGQAWLNAHFDMAQEPDAEVTPSVEAGQTQPPFEFQGGDVGSLFLGGVLDASYDGGFEGTVIGDEKHPAPFPALFDYFRYRDNDSDIVDQEGNVIYYKDEIWTATIPIYFDDACCTNPSQDIPIQEFAKIVIRMPNPPPDKTVTVSFDCNSSVIQGRGGGGNGNLKGTIPQLVE